MKQQVLAGLALVGALSMFSDQASAAAVGFTGTGGFVVAGGIGDLTGICGAGCDSGFVPFTTGGLLFDGMVISGNVREVVQDNGVNATSALLLVTDIVATNFGPNTISDTMFIVSDVFSPSVPGPVGVGIIGSFLSNAGAFGNISFASVQAQMNFLLAPLPPFGGPLAGFSLTTVSPFVSCVACSPVPFWASSFGFDAGGGVVQLIGAINFTLGPGTSIYMPGSLLIESNNDAAILAETPEPGTFGLLGGAMIGIAFGIKRYKR